jgi:hypothetical protein
MEVAEGGKARDAGANAVLLPRPIPKLSRNRTTRLTESCGQLRKDETRTALLPTYAVPSCVKNYFPVYAIRQMVFDPSSVTSNDPSGATVIPTGRPQTFPLGSTNPVTKSSYSPLAWPV